MPQFIPYHNVFKYKVFTQKLLAQSECVESYYIACCQPDIPLFVDMIYNFSSALLLKSQTTLHDGQILLITRIITDRIGLQSVLLPLVI